MNRTLALRLFLLWLAYLLGGPSLLVIGQAVPVPPPGGFTIQPVKQLRPAPEPPGGLVPYREGNLWGYCDTLGQIWIKPTFGRETTFFVRGFAQVMREPKHLQPEGAYYWLNARGECLNSGSDYAVIPTPDGALRAIRRRRNRSGKELVIIAAADTLALIAQLPPYRYPQPLAPRLFSVERGWTATVKLWYSVRLLLPVSFLQWLNDRYQSRGIIDDRGRRLGRKVYKQIAPFKNGEAFVLRKTRGDTTQLGRLDSTGRPLGPFQWMSIAQAQVYLRLAKPYPIPLDSLYEALAQRLDSALPQDAPPTYRVSYQANGTWRLLDLQERPITRFYPAAQQLVHFHVPSRKLLVKALLHPERPATPETPIIEYEGLSYQTSYLLLDSTGTVLEHLDAVKSQSWIDAPTKFGLNIHAFVKRDSLKSATRLDYDPSEAGYYYYEYQHGRFLPYLLEAPARELAGGWLFFEYGYQVASLTSHNPPKRIIPSVLRSPTGALHPAPTDYQWSIHDRSYYAPFYKTFRSSSLQYAFPPFERGVQLVESWQGHIVLIGDVYYLGLKSRGYITRGGRQLYKD